MSELRRDPFEERWVIFAPERSRRPRPRPVETPPAAGPCPFCPGNEARTRPERRVLRDAVGNWRVRLVPNYFPILGDAPADAPRHCAVGDVEPGAGVHEVVVETPRHGPDLGDLAVSEIADVVGLWQERLRELHQDPRLRQSVIFKNKGIAAGASLEHAHSQIVGLPILPPRHGRQLAACLRHLRRTGQSLLPELLQGELEDGRRIVRHRDGFVTLAPFASAFRYELVLAPDRHRPRFADLAAAECRALAAALRDALRRVKTALDDPAYNLILFVEPSPRGAESVELLGRAFQWHCRLVPRLASPAGFELGAEMAVNATLPEEAAGYLRDVAVEPEAGEEP